MEITPNPTPNKEKKSCIEAIKEHLESGKTITQNDALRLYGTSRLASVIHDLRKKYDMPIITKPIEVVGAFGKQTEHKSVIAVYFLQGLLPRQQELNL